MANTKGENQLSTTEPQITDRQLSNDDVVIINEIKDHAEMIRHLLNRVIRHIEEESSKPLPEGHAPHSTVTDPFVWAEEAQKDLQKGFMSLVRSVARPSTF